MKSWFSKISVFLRQVREEIAKCTRPATAELKESTLVIVTTMVTLGIFIFVSDYLISRVLNLILKLRI